MRRDDDRHQALLRHATLRDIAPAVQHEVNNALMVMTSNLEMLARHVPEGPPRRQLDRVGAAARKLDGTVRAFLDLLRRDGPAVEEVSPLAVVGGLLPLLGVALGAGGRFEVAPGEVPAVRLDRAALELDLLRLARAAAAAMEPGAAIRAQGVAEAAGVALILTLPRGAAGFAPSPALQAGLAAVRAEPGRLALVWPAA